MEPKDTFIAHIKTDSNSNKIIQTCSNHLENSAKYSADALKDLDLCSTGYFAGLHHDILDQNSKIIRDCIDDDSIILEHHSNE